MKSQFKAVIFDFDGTIADTAEGVFESIRYACNKMQKEIPADNILKEFIGPPLLYSFKEYAGCSEEESPTAVEYYREYYTDEGLFKLKFYDGIIDLVKLLRDNGIKVGIASAKPDVFIQRILEHFEVKDLFDYAKGISITDYCTDKSYLFEKVTKELKIDDMSKVLVIGDKCFDVDGAKSIGAVGAGVLFGYGSAEEFSNADFVAENTDNLISYIFN